MELEFKALIESPPGLVALLLAKSYAQLMQDDPVFRDDYYESWQAYDAEIHAEPGTVGACGFVSYLGDEPVGFASWDPRKFPVGIVGHNCVLPDFRGRGFGKCQIIEVLHRLKAKGFEQAVVTTHDASFFVPAQKMYLACGFQEEGRFMGGKGDRYSLIKYNRIL